MKRQGIWLALGMVLVAGLVPAQGAPSRLQEDLQAGLQAGLQVDLQVDLQTGLVGLDSFLGRSLDMFVGGLDGLGAVTFETRPLGPMPRTGGVASGLTVGMADSWQSGLAYMLLTCPNGSFPSREGAGVCVSYDDSRLWATSWPGFQGLQPSATVGFEPDQRLRAMTDRAVFLQLGIKPGYELKLPGDHPVVASVPVTVGLGSDYDPFTRTSNPVLGYLDIGVTVSTPLSSDSRWSGSWGLTAGVNFLFLGDGREVLNGGEDFDVLASITLGFEF